MITTIEELIYALNDAQNELVFERSNEYNSDYDNAELDGQLNFISHLRDLICE